MVPTFIVALALASLATAATAPTVVDIEAIEAHFKQALIVPTLFPTFSPGAILDVAFSGKPITPGQALAQEAVAAQPVVTVSAFNASLAGNYTIAMVDADVVGTPAGNVNRHWLENYMSISDGTLSNSSGVPVTEYAGPGPAAGSGPHRYVVLLYAQPTTFIAPAGLTGGVQKFDLNAYVKDSGLGDIIAANYFTVEVGTNENSALPATSAVVTSTLAPAPSGAAGGSSAGGAAGPSGTNSGAAPGSSQPGSAMSLKFESGAALLAMAAMLLIL
ncbi:phosphatidylethanolamine-binding protein [Mycena filopes]|nr:phosphatidylethanolamine-binding protein [Mycena filopes]